MKYKELKDIPPHIFKNRILTWGVGHEFKEYLRYLLDNYPDDLKYIHLHEQKYIAYGGAYNISFKSWKQKLDNNLKRDGY